MKKFFLVIPIFLLVLSILGPWQSVQASMPHAFSNLSSEKSLKAQASQVDPALQAFLDALQPGDRMTVIVTLKDQAILDASGMENPGNRQQFVIQNLQAHAQASQRAILAVLEASRGQGRVSQVIPFWIFNGLSVTATGDMIQELAARDDVASITADAINVVPVGNLALAAPASNLSVINAPALWNLGFYGQGVVVANLDSGVDVSHPDLSTRWRGGSNSWYDPYGQHPTTPVDLSGHGTWTMGVMVGGDASGNTLGVAPGAQWIAAKIFNDAGSATATAIHQAFQWALNPDGNNGTADAPQVINNSWAFGSPGCNLEFQNDLRALRLAGILSVFAGGNYGPGTATSVSPANYPEAFAVGAVDNGDSLYAYGSRGPSACGEISSIYPELVAPGVNITSTDLFGLYTSATGTSLSAPHATGALALLLNAFPGLNADLQSTALTLTAVDLGPAGPDNDFGYGRLDVLAAYNWLAAGGVNSTPTPTPTALPSPTATPTLTPMSTPISPVNLALNRPVSVSSFQDSSSTGSMAVDGNLGTLWKTIKYSGKTKPSSEWITIDLGSSVSVGQVVLEWDAYYATQYIIQVSNDNSTWTTVSSTTNGNGANDTLNFAQTSARYVKLVTTGWTNSSLRNWLREMQVYMGSGSPPPSPTPTAAPTATPTPGASANLHVGDLDGTKSSVNRKTWSATVTIYVHDANENPLASATVSGVWNNGISGTLSCSTNSLGNCQVSAGSISTNISSATFTVTGVTKSAYTYVASSNHDPDGDSNGTAITILMP